MKFIFILAFLYFLWQLDGRNIYICFRYSKEKGIPFNYEISREELMEKIRKDLHYPGLKETYYDECGRITLRCTFGPHSLKMEDGVLYISKSEALGSIRKKSHYLEEAECIKAYIQKMFDPDAPVNPSHRYNKLKKFRVKTLVAIAIVFICAGAMLIYADSESPNSLVDATKSSNISQSYLTSYSETVTIGEAFDNFFSETEWVPHSDGAREYVDFKGNCMYGDDTVTMIIRFAVGAERFEIESITMDGEVLSPLDEAAVLETVYSTYEEDYQQ